MLDSIAWALGGENFRPSDATRDGSIIPPNLKIVLNNGLIVERKGKNSALKVTDPSGQKAGQSLLNTFVESLALNLPKFMESSGKEKAQTLLQIIGVGNQLAELERRKRAVSGSAVHRPDCGSERKVRQRTAILPGSTQGSGLTICADPAAAGHSCSEWRKSKEKRTGRKDPGRGKTRL